MKRYFTHNIPNIFITSIGHCQDTPHIVVDKPTNLQVFRFKHRSLVGTELVPQDKLLDSRLEEEKGLIAISNFEFECLLLNGSRHFQIGESNCLQFTTRKMSFKLFCFIQFAHNDLIVPNKSQISLAIVTLFHAPRD